MVQKEPFLTALKNRILLFDGAMGTEIQKYNPKPEDFPNFVAGERADILCSIERSYWGTSRVRLRLVDETRR